jgi:hypothetical protein
MIDHRCHARNAIGQRSLDPIGRVALVHGYTVRHIDSRRKRARASKR